MWLVLLAWLDFPRLAGLALPCSPTTARETERHWSWQGERVGLTCLVFLAWHCCRGPNKPWGDCGGYTGSGLRICLVLSNHVIPARCVCYLPVLCYDVPAVPDGGASACREPEWMWCLSPVVPNRHAPALWSIIRVVVSAIVVPQSEASLSQPNESLDLLPQPLLYRLFVNSQYEGQFVAATVRP